MLWLMQPKVAGEGKAEKGAKPEVEERQAGRKRWMLVLQGSFARFNRDEENPRLDVTKEVGVP